jgi:membrane-associated phospholipid phosphatase
MISTDTSANVIHKSVMPQGLRGICREPRRAALAWVVGYLATTGVVLATSGHLWLVALHSAVMLVAVLAIRAEGGAGRLVGDLLPLIVAPLLYGEIPALISAMSSTYHDPAVQGWEAAVFGGQVSQTFAAAAPVRWASEVLHAGYLSYYALIFAPPLLLWARRERRGLSQTVLALTVTCLVCWAVFVVWPVQGPRYLWGAPAGVPDGFFRRIDVRLLASGSSRGAAFPSSHMAVSAAQAVMSWRWQHRTVAWAISVVAVLIGVGAVYGGFHYGVDMIAGGALGVGVGAYVILRSPERSDED